MYIVHSSAWHRKQPASLSQLRTLHIFQCFIILDRICALFESHKVLQNFQFNCDYIISNVAVYSFITPLIQNINMLPFFLIIFKFHRIYFSIHTGAVCSTWSRTHYSTTQSFVMIRQLFFRRYLLRYCFFSTHRFVSFPFSTHAAQHVSSKCRYYCGSKWKALQLRNNWWFSIGVSRVLFRAMLRCLSVTIVVVVCLSWAAWLPAAWYKQPSVWVVMTDMTRQVRHTQKSGNGNIVWAPTPTAERQSTDKQVNKHGDHDFSCQNNKSI